MNIGNLRERLGEENWSFEGCADRPHQCAGVSGLNIEKATRQADASKRLLFSFSELPEVKEALKQRDEVRAAVAESLANEPLNEQVENLRDDILKMLKKMNDEPAAKKPE